MGNQHKEYNPDGCERLANAIVTSTCKSYRRALRTIKKNPNNKAAINAALDCEEFFLGDWMRTLTNVDGKWLRDRLRQEVQEEYD